MEIAPTPPPSVALDTTDKSLLHSLASRWLGNGGTKAPSAFKTPVLAVLVTYLPLLIFASLTRPRIMTWHQVNPPSSRTAVQTPPAPPTAGSRTPERLAFLDDWNVMFLFMITFPVIATLAVRDQHVLVSSIDRVRADGVLTDPDHQWNELCSRWKDAFKRLNILFQVCGLIVGAAVVWGNYDTYVQGNVGYWIAPQGTLLRVGYVYLYCIFLFYFVISIYILRNIAISFFLRDLAAHSNIHVLPLHPDRCAGLRPIGEVGLRNQYALSVGGLNIVILWFIYEGYFPTVSRLKYLVVAVMVMYTLFSPPLFLGPLLPFRTAMLNARTTLMNQVAQRMRLEIDAIILQLQGGQIAKRDVDMVSRLSRLGMVIDKLPVWPFDLRTLHKFLTAYVAPAMGAILVELGKDNLKNLRF